jgi:hypothetical protein
MLPKRSLARTLTLVALLHFYVTGTGAYAAGTELQKVLADWENRAKRAGCIRYHVTGQSILPKGSLRDVRNIPLVPETPNRDIVGTVALTVLVDFPGKRYRLDLEEEIYDQGTDRLYPNVRTNIFDGTLLRSYRPRARNTHPISGLKASDVEYATGKGDLKRAVIPTTYWPLFVSHGSVPSSTETITADQLVVRPDPELLYVHGHASHNGAPCIVVRSQLRRGAMPSFDEYWIDMGKESAIVRQCVYMDKTAHIDFHIEYQQTAGGWLPKRWTNTQREPISGKTDYVQDLTVTSVELAPPAADSDYTIEPKTGTIVAELTYPLPKAGESRFTLHPETTMYQVDENGGRHEVTVTADGTVHRRWSWWWSAGAVVPALGGAYYWWHRHRVRRFLRPLQTNSGDAPQSQPDS